MIYAYVIPAARLLRLEGEESLDLLQRLTTNDVTPVRHGFAVPTLLVTEKGKIVDLLIVAADPAKSCVYLSCSGTSAVTVQELLERFIIMEDVRITDISEGVHTVISWSTHDHQWIVPDHEVGDEGTILTAHVPLWKHSLRWTCIVRPGDIRSSEDVSLLTRTEFDAARVAAGVPWCGTEISASFNPLEARLRSLISFTKGCYIGQEVIARLDTYRKVQRVFTRITGTVSQTEENEDFRLTTVTSGGGLGFVRHNVLNAEPTDASRMAATFHALDRDRSSGIYSESL